MSILGAWWVVSWLDARRARDGYDASYERERLDASSLVLGVLGLAVYLLLGGAVWLATGGSWLAVGGFLMVVALAWAYAGWAVSSLVWLAIVSTALTLNERKLQRRRMERER